MAIPVQANESIGCSGTAEDFYANNRDTNKKSSEFLITAVMYFSS